MVTSTTTYSGVLPLVANPPIYKKGIDVSKWQGKMDWGKAAGAGVQFAAVRCTVGDYYVDPRFEENWAGAKEVGIPVTAYHVVAPADGGRRITGKKQMEYFADKMEGKFPDYPLILDCELAKGQDARWITSVIEKCVEEIPIAFDTNPFIYTAKYWWNANVWESSMWKECPLWVANYTSFDEPQMPRDWLEYYAGSWNQKWTVWQWSADGNGMGHQHGAQSHAIDLDRWNPNVPFLFGDNNEPPLPPVPPPNNNMTVQMQALFGDDVYIGEAVLEKE